MLGRVGGGYSAGRASPPAADDNRWSRARGAPRRPSRSAPGAASLCGAARCGAAAFSRGLETSPGLNAGPCGLLESGAMRWMGPRPPRPTCAHRRPRPRGLWLCLQPAGLWGMRSPAGCMAVGIPTSCTEGRRGLQTHPEPHTRSTTAHLAAPLCGNAAGGTASGLCCATGPWGHAALGTRSLVASPWPRAGGRHGCRMAAWGPSTASI